MKVTGLILALVGLIGGILCVANLIMPVGPDREIPPVAGEASHRFTMTVPLVVCGAALVIGIALFVFGGRGYFVSNNPRVRN